MDEMQLATLADTAHLTLSDWGTPWELVVVASEPAPCILDGVLESGGERLVLFHFIGSPPYRPLRERDFLAAFARRSVGPD